MWKTFGELDTLATHFGRGIRELGHEPRKNIVIFAETRAEWMIAAHGLFKHAIPGTLPQHFLFVPCGYRR